MIGTEKIKSVFAEIPHIYMRLRNFISMCLVAFVVIFTASTVVFSASPFATQQNYYNVTLNKAGGTGTITINGTSYTGTTNPVITCTWNGSVSIVCNLPALLNGTTTSASRYLTRTNSDVRYDPRNGTAPSNYGMWCDLPVGHANFFTTANCYNVSNVNGSSVYMPMTTTTLYAAYGCITSGGAGGYYANSTTTCGPVGVGYFAKPGIGYRVLCPTDYTTTNDCSVHPVTTTTTASGPNQCCKHTLYSDVDSDCETSDVMSKTYVSTCSYSATATGYGEQLCTPTNYGVIAFSGIPPAIAGYYFSGITLTNSANNDNSCIPVGNGYYSPSGTGYRWSCPVSSAYSSNTTYSTATNTSSFIYECLASEPASEKDSDCDGTITSTGSEGTYGTPSLTTYTASDGTYNYDLGSYQSVTTLPGYHLNPAYDGSSITDMCTPVGYGYFSSGNNAGFLLSKFPCPSGYTTSTTTASSILECYKSEDAETLNQYCASGVRISNVNSAPNGAASSTPSLDWQAYLLANGYWVLLNDGVTNAYSIDTWPTFTIAYSTLASDPITAISGGSYTGTLYPDSSICSPPPNTTLTLNKLNGTGTLTTANGTYTGTTNAALTCSGTSCLLPSIGGLTRQYATVKYNPRAVSTSIGNYGQWCTEPVGGGTCYIVTSSSGTTFTIPSYVTTLYASFGCNPGTYASSNTTCSHAGTGYYSPGYQAYRYQCPTGTTTTTTAASSQSSCQEIVSFSSLDSDCNGNNRARPVTGANYTAPTTGFTYTYASGVTFGAWIGTPSTYPGYYFGGNAAPANNDDICIPVGLGYWAPGNVGPYRFACPPGYTTDTAISSFIQSCVIKENASSLNSSCATGIRLTTLPNGYPNVTDFDFYDSNEHNGWVVYFVVNGTLSGYTYSLSVWPDFTTAYAEDPNNLITPVSGGTYTGLLTPDSSICTPPGNVVITLDKAGGSGTVLGATGTTSATLVCSGTSCTIPSITSSFTRSRSVWNYNPVTGASGVTAVRWCTALVGGGTCYTPGTYTFASNTTLYAAWGCNPGYYTSTGNLYSCDYSVGGGYFSPIGYAYRFQCPTGMSTYVNDSTTRDAIAISLTACRTQSQLLSGVDSNCTAGYRYHRAISATYSTTPTGTTFTYVGDLVQSDNTSGTVTTSAGYYYPNAPYAADICPPVGTGYWSPGASESGRRFACPPGYTTDTTISSGIVDQCYKTSDVPALNGNCATGTRIDYVGLITDATYNYYTNDSTNGWIDYMHDYGNLDSANNVTLSSWPAFGWDYDESVSDPITAIDGAEYTGELYPDTDICQADNGFELYYNKVGGTGDVTTTHGTYSGEDEAFDNGCIDNGDGTKHCYMPGGPELGRSHSDQFVNPWNGTSLGGYAQWCTQKSGLGTCFPADEDYHIISNSVLRVYLSWGCDAGYYSAADGLSCIPVGNGYWSPEGFVDRYPCPPNFQTVSNWCPSVTANNNASFITQCSNNEYVPNLDSNCSAGYRSKQVSSNYPSYSGYTYYNSQINNGWIDYIQNFGNITGYTRHLSSWPTYSLTYQEEDECQAIAANTGYYYTGTLYPDADICTTTPPNTVLTLDKAGGTGTVLGATLTTSATLTCSGTSCTLPSITSSFTRANSVWNYNPLTGASGVAAVRWCTGYAGSGTCYNGGSTYTFTSNTTLYAAWGCIAGYYTATNTTCGVVGAVYYSPVGSGYRYQCPPLSGYTPSTFTTTASALSACRVKQSLHDIDSGCAPGTRYKSATWSAYSGPTAFTYTAIGSAIYSAWQFDSFDTYYSEVGNNPGFYYAGNVASEDENPIICPPVGVGYWTPGYALYSVGNHRMACPPGYTTANEYSTSIADCYKSEQASVLDPGECATGTRLTYVGATDDEYYLYYDDIDSYWIDTFAANGDFIIDNYTLSFAVWPNFLETYAQGDTITAATGYEVSSPLVLDPATSICVAGDVILTLNKAGGTGTITTADGTYGTTTSATLTCSGTSCTFPSVTTLTRTNSLWNYNPQTGASGITAVRWCTGYNGSGTCYNGGSTYTITSNTILYAAWGCDAGYFAFSNASCAQVGTSYYSATGSAYRYQCPTNSTGTNATTATTTAAAVTDCFYQNIPTNCTAGEKRTPITSAPAPTSLAGNTYTYSTDPTGVVTGTPVITTALSAPADWYTDSTSFDCLQCGTSYPNSTGGTGGQGICYAAISYDSNGGLGTMSGQSCYYGQTCLLSANAFTNGISTFIGWGPTSISAATVGDGCSYSPSGDTTLYAEWYSWSPSLHFGADSIQLSPSRQTTPALNILRDQTIYYGYLSVTPVANTPQLKVGSTTYSLVPDPNSVPLQCP